MLAVALQIKQRVSIFIWRNGVKLSTLDYFVAVATERSFTKAADKLFISQPTLSRRITELENEVGVNLFIRQPHGVELTSEGDRFLTEVTSVLDRVNRLDHLFDQDKQSAGLAVIKVGYLPGFNLGKMYQILNEFKAMHPTVQYLVKQDEPTQLVSGLKEGQYDITFNLASYLAHQADIRQKRFLKNRLQIALPVNHPLSHYNKLTFADLSQETFILLERQRSPVIVDYVLNQGLQNGFNLKANYYVKNLDEGLSMTSLGKGLAFLYSGMNDGTLEDKYKIKIVDLDISDQQQNIVCAMDINNHTRLVRELFEAFHTE